MGLLDSLNSDEGMQALGLLAAAGPSATPMSFGQRLFGAMQQDQARRTEAEDRKMRLQMQQMQMQQLMEAAAGRKKAAEQEQQRASYLGAIDSSQGPPMQMSVPRALASGLSLPEIGALMPKQEDPMAGFDKVSPKDYTPESLAMFVQTRNPGVLRAAQKDDKPPADWQLYQLSGAAQRGLTFDQWDQSRRRAGATNVSVNTGDKIPTALVKQQDDLIDRISTARSIDADLGAVAKQIEGGQLKFGPVRNLLNTGKNIAGVSDDESRAFGTFKSTLEKLRNDSLRLNSGVQTEGDAQRAWNELFQNINDTKFVGQRMKEIQAINQRAAKLQEYRLNVLRQNSGAGPLPQPPIEPAIDASGVPRAGAVEGGYRFKGGNPADPKNWEKL